MADSNAARRKRAEQPDSGRATAPLKGIRGAAPTSASDESLELDSLIHHRMRLGIVSALAGTDSLTFNELKGLLATTDGNLSVHARKLEEAHYVTCTKSFESRRPRTEYRLAPAGRRALQRYLDHMEALIQATRTTLAR
ncbi:MAG: transcriptional regulator [Gemmatimonadaceae bacterium]